ncbi:phage holin family protein [Microlunatus sp. Gsoil 973]|uniref:phage holin family protein n=1 Tax=Microlunatus sp. Gsoil 973 TaxID=2672569 RepID=UPI0018A80C8E|nr:phage holin family protein [Microlunatus sp. Gsoil 973]
MTSTNTGQVPQAPGVGDILKDIQAEVSNLIKDEVELAKSELVPSAKSGGIGAGLFGGALYFVLNALILLFIAGSLAIWKWLDLPIALGFVIMAGVLIVVAVILGLIGLVAVKRVKGPERAIAQGQRTADSVKAAIARGNAAATAKKIEGSADQPQIAARASRN